MSQEKVDKYKQEKVNRKKNMKKEKFRNFMRKCAVAVAGVVLIGWIGYSASPLCSTFHHSLPLETIVNHFIDYFNPFFIF